jgi:hypothetical protein
LSSVHPIEKFKWHKIGLAKQEKIDKLGNSLKSLKTLIKENGDWGKRKILECDCVMHI